MKSLCCLSKWEDFSLISLVKQKLRRDVIAVYTYRLERRMCGSACWEDRKERATSETALAQQHMKTMYLEIRTKYQNLKAVLAFQERLQRDENLTFSEMILYMVRHRILQWPQCCRQTLPVHNSPGPMTEKRIIFTVTANEISQILVMRKGLSNGSP